MKYLLVKVLFLIFAGSVLSACGFQPMYSSEAGGGPVGVGLSQVEIERPTTRTAQIVRNELLKLFEIGGRQDKKYRLQNQFKEQQVDLAIQLDASTTRKNLIMWYDFKLLESSTDKEVFKGSGRTYAAYNLVQSDYANLVAEKDARERAAKEIAYQIRTRLATFFANRG